MIFYYMNLKIIHAMNIHFVSVLLRIIIKQLSNVSELKESESLSSNVILVLFVTN